MQIAFFIFNCSFKKTLEKRTEEVFLKEPNVGGRGCMTTTVTDGGQTLWLNKCSYKVKLFSNLGTSGRGGFYTFEPNEDHFIGKDASETMYSLKFDDD